MAGSLKKLGSALARTVSRSSTGASSDSGASSSSEDEGCPDSRGGTAETTPSHTPATTTAFNSPAPSISIPMSPLQRTVSALSRFSLSPHSGSDPFEAYEAERKKRERKARKETEKKVAAFHSDITGAVFVGTVKFCPDEATDSPSLAGPSTEKDKEGDSKTSIVTERIRIGIVDIKPKDSPGSKSRRHDHFTTFASYYNDYEKNGAVLECFFDVFLRDVPREGTRVLFFAKPTGENGEYVAVACNVETRYNRF